MVWLKDQIGIFHACLAQAFLALVSLIALGTSRWWGTLGNASLLPAQREKVRQVAWLTVGIAVLIYVQLALGAAMRHAHAGLSIRDFPTAYGHWWPATDPASVAAINQERSTLGLPLTTAGLILLQMFHRLGAFVVAAGVTVLTVMVARNPMGLERRLRRLALAGWVLIGSQIALGICTIWTNKAADVATSHVAVGAASLVWAVLTSAGLLRWGRTTSRKAAPLPALRTELAEVAVAR